MMCSDAQWTCREISAYSMPALGRNGRCLTASTRAVMRTLKHLALVSLGPTFVCTATGYSGVASAAECTTVQDTMSSALPELTAESSWPFAGPRQGLIAKVVCTEVVCTEPSSPIPKNREGSI